MPHQLVALTDGPNIPLDKPIVLLGRHQECDIQLGSRKVSRKHCCLAQVNDYLVVRDLGSTNGVRINGARVSEGILRAHDELTIGNQRYQLTPDSTPPMRPGNAAKAAAASASPPKTDARLESCEVPVPLAESPSILKGLPVAAPPGTNGTSGPPEKKS
jgi:predicted component of type VI protein secretion system